MSKDQKPNKEKMQTADDILSSLMDDLKDVDKGISDDDAFANTLGLDRELLKNISAADDGAIQLEEGSVSGFLAPDAFNIDVDSNNSIEGLTGLDLPNDPRVPNPLDQFNTPPEAPKVAKREPSLFDNIRADEPVAAAAEAAPHVPPVISESGPSLFGSSDPLPPLVNNNYSTLGVDEKTAATEVDPAQAPMEDFGQHDNGDGEKTVAVAGFSQRASEDYGDKVKVSVGQMRGNAFSSGYAAWGSSDSNLAHAENLRIAQEKILDLEKDNEKLRSQNEELIAASEIVKERADLLTGQLHEFKADRDSLEQSFKNETGILKSQMMRKDAEIVKASMKIEELESRMKFDLKKIRVRERELENRLELIRAEKNALVKSKDDQILDVRRKLDQVQLEVESYRQKCVDLNKVIDTNQESFKRTTRALRLAMANLELQEENKPVLKKVD
ncbi:hypothetical protein CIK05_13305 [Bdellovibrio sp. qaytius]|nr:hypothetical protein CIK05_13305 [Bdellovibrio sp. qaytius]